ncbi:N-acetylmuramoyl-L-alanine amidase [Rhodospirillum rubrum]|uniref:N-acetylmuramoyl-L-alanine amidase n=1 Tax=Rhodospirillum rubrum (strain ATCC 11170 / ATH 1.1.1 / DSM 467 / LMG 4362 / NCIMB 8255 / S1) TaxID=269796 RepID=Q2RVT4_RHORT|nr:N-acetylmuramoyl-L-alanine amidase [Rhodospirillum rubrum]ABC21761.1 AmpD (negative regulator of AmpC) [Rhodospirillum rubrum ATCC 11170]AEO47459.1 AmpD (negative regulator of AmpC) [Rhodospirillum rubrum F11]MBK5953318.1 N-acetylmuramoyl-L-alanine amidase [Rhodospirillum rubrum]QXG81423.1 N-acetylmuramoyl-L-alanine amidase [Rhodospirillum rubrum]HCF19078.1 N-acetylmuramoyl-L-alanine amidase [Rhodospirillum rubrum]
MASRPAPPDFPVIEALSPNADDRPPGQIIDMLVIHYTGMPSAQAALARLLDPQAQVSAHWLIDEDGTAYKLVEERRRAWHAGVSAWGGRPGVNARSIGIELVNPGHEFGYRPFPEAQMTTLIALGRGILERHPIPAAHVVGHADVAPTRKEDPGELFDWQRLASNGIGRWPPPPLGVRPETVDATEGEAACLLEQIGYDISSLQATVLAFQRHFRPKRLDGRIDSETLWLIKALARDVQAH